MTTLMIILAVAGGILLLLILYSVGIYNHLVQLKNRFVNAFSQIDVQLQRRNDLIPNLVETAKTYMQYEKETLTKVIEARNQSQTAVKAIAKKPDDNEAMQKLIAAEGTLSSSMGKFFALAENYPDLKANQAMQQLMEELSSTENKVGFARQAFNDAVMDFNTYRSQFPNVLFANTFGFQPATHFQVTDEKVREAVKVSFG